ncbi:MAG: hypothetical protein OQJ97_06125 [Rhodospirillales bacterium]|nr:hypothetical protein [Rhodospirillales bacterium]
MSNLADAISWANSLSFTPKITLSAILVAIPILLLTIIWAPKKNSSEETETKEKNPSNLQIELTRDEEKALGLVLTDPQAGDRGAWTYPLHQQLTYRGLSDVQATSALNALVRKGLLVSVNVETRDSMTGKPTTAPAYKVTETGFLYAAKHEQIMKFEQKYYYTLRVMGAREENSLFLEHLQDLDFIERQTRFINEKDQNASRIAIFSYNPISEKLIKNIAKMFKVVVLGFSKR